MHVGSSRTDWLEIAKGVRQGCVMSPDLFSLCGQKATDDLRNPERINIGERNINNIRYADDTVLMAGSEERLRQLMN